MIQSLPFTSALQAIADANGNASMQDGPSTANEAWTITSQHVFNPGPRVPLVRAYMDFVAQSSFIEGTTRGTQAASDTVINLQSGQIVIYQWSGCTPGTACNVTIKGTRQVAF